MDSCLLCLELNNKLVDFIETNSTRWQELNITKILEKHFWPIDTMYSCSKMCLSCWKQLEDFNNFYTRIEEAHENFGKIQIKEDKISCNESEPFSFACLEQEMVKDYNTVLPDNNVYEQVEDNCDISEDLTNEDQLLESNLTNSSNNEDQNKEQAKINADPNDSSNSNNMDSSYNNDTDSDYEPDTNSSENVKDKVNNKKKDIFIKKHFKQILCDLCATPLENFSSMRKHFRNVHKQRAYLTCCNIRFYSKSTFVDHLHIHLNPDYFKCQHCDKVLAYRQSFEKHMLIRHRSKSRQKVKHLNSEGDQKHHTEKHPVSGKQDHPYTVSGRVLRNHTKICHEEEILKDQNSLVTDNKVSNHVENNCHINEHVVNKDPLEEANLTHSSNGEITKTTTQTNSKEDQNNEEEEINIESCDSNNSNSVNNMDKAAANGSNESASKSVKYKDVNKKIDKFIAKHFKRMFCNLCNMPFESFTSMKQHYLKVHKQRCFLVCCNKKFYDKCRFVDHLHTHLNPDHFKCPHCDKVLSNRESLEKHTLRKHTTKGVNQKNHKKVSKHLGGNNCDINKDKVNRDPLANKDPLEITKTPTQRNTKEQNNKADMNPETYDSSNLPNSNSNSNMDKNPAYKQHTNGLKAISKKNEKFIAENLKQILCSLCNIPFKKFGNLMTHFQKVHKQSGYIVCCNKKFFDKPRLVDHLHTHLNPDHFKCPHCDKVLSDRMNLEIHMLHKHRPEGVKLKYTCETCGKSFANTTYLRKHKMCHLPQEEKKFRCAKCGKHYAASYRLKKHREECMVYRKKCHICGNTFTSSGGYKTHMNKHVTPPTIINCDICGIRLASKQGLQLHKETLHPVGGRQDHPCPVCHKIFSSKRALRHHNEIMHGKGYDYKCNICEKGFKRLLDLKDHCVIHTENPKCSWCPLTFKSRVSMYTHRKKMHPKEWKESKLEKYSGNLPTALAKAISP